MIRGAKKLKRGKLKWGVKKANHGRKGAYGKRKKFRTLAQAKKQR
ncbi:MAG TPA: hypothetical protein VFF73_02880 [Planctomycetota bacterium]|nr:hypothetical protein [Planctomycetota bacterium]